MVEPVRESQKRNPNMPWEERALRTLMARLEVKLLRKEVGKAIVMIAALPSLYAKCDDEECRVSMLD